MFGLRAHLDVNSAASMIYVASVAWDAVKTYAEVIKRARKKRKRL